MLSAVITITGASNPAFASCLLNASALPAEVAAAILDLCPFCAHRLVSDIPVCEILSEANPGAPFPRESSTALPPTLLLRSYQVS